MAAGSTPVSIAVDPTGRFAYVTNDSSNDVSAYAINPITGALTSIGPNVAAGTTPVPVTVGFADSEQRGSEGGTGAPTSCEQSHSAGSLRSGGNAEQEAGAKQTCSDGAQQGRSTGLTGP